MNRKRIIFPISPQTNVRTTQGVRMLFRIPEVCYKGRNGTGCVLYHRTGVCKHTLSKEGRRRKKRIERYNKYKQDVLFLAKKNRFELPFWGWALYFYFPMPIRWSKKKRAAMHGQPHLREPDLDNLEKAFFDSLSITDEQVGQMAGHGKFWVDKPGFIEILLEQPVYNPFGVHFIDQKIWMKNLK